MQTSGELGREIVHSNSQAVWWPSSIDTARIDGWYSELDETKNSQVGGAKIVKFLMGSTLPKDILRTIWELGDSDKRGYVDRAQFTRMIRLVSICQRPGFEAPPTMDKYYASVNDLIPLPSFGESAQQAVPVAAPAKRARQPRARVSTTPALSPHHKSSPAHRLLHRGRAR